MVCKLSSLDVEVVLFGPRGTALVNVQVAVISENRNGHKFLFAGTLMTTILPVWWFGKASHLLYLLL